MNNPYQVVLARITQGIPHQVLSIALKAFNEENNKHYNLTTFIQEHIMTRVILPELNLAGGRVKTIPLRTEYIENTKMEHAGYAGDDGPYTLFRIPPEARDNLPISNILSVQYPYNTYLGGGVNSSDIGLTGFCLVDQIDEVLNSYTLARPRNHPTAVLLSGDLVRLAPSQYAMQNWLMTCRLNFDAALTNLHDHAIGPLADLTLLALKQWIYTTLIIDIDRVSVETGAEIGTIKSVIEGYSDAGQQYAEQFVQARGAMLLEPTMRRQMLYFHI